MSGFPARRPGKVPSGTALRLAAVAALVAPLVAGCGSDGSDGDIVLNLYKYPQENMQTIVDNCNEDAGGAYTIVYNKLPRTADGQREQMVRRLAAEDADMDIMALDVTWTAEFAEAGWILEWTGDNKDAATEDVLPGPLDTAMWQDKLYAATDNTNVQLLWYRKDLVDTPPETFDELIAAAKELKDAGETYAVGMTGAQYEGLVVQFNTLVQSAGGKIISDDGKKALVDDGAVKALEVLRDFANSGVTSPRLSNSFEDDVRLEFQDDKLAFELNWPYVYAAMKTEDPELFKDLAWAPYPGVTKGDPAKVTVGGIDYAISAFSEHPDEAFEATLCMRSAENQKFAALNDGVPPTIESVYDEPEMAEAYPMKDTILEELKVSSSRPVTPAYQNASTVMSTVLSPPSEIDPEATAAELREQLQDALDSKGVLP